MPATSAGMTAEWLARRASPRTWRAPSPRLRGEGIGGLRPPFFTSRTPMRSIGYGEGALPRFLALKIAETPPHPDRFAVRPLPASGERRNACGGRAARHRCRPIHLSNSHTKSAAALVGPAGGRLVFPAVARRVFALEDRGAERRLAPRKLHALAGVRAPLAKGTQRPSALRAAVYGLRGRASADRAFPALALGVAIITVANESREGRSAPGAIPVPPEGRACKARGAGAAPRSTMDASGGALE
jgi:hypothetical protein